MATTVQNLGRRLRSLRQAQGLSLDELADRSGISAKHIGKVERGTSKISVECLSTLAQALNIPVKDILETDHEQTGQELQDDIISLLPQLAHKDIQIVYRLVKMLAGR